MTSDILLSVEGLSVRYGEAQALSDVSLAVRRGQITSIVGANGAGKTTLVRAIAGMVSIATGRVRYCNDVLAKKSSADICELGIGQVPEGRQIFPSLSVEDNLKAGSLLRRARDRRAAMFELVYDMFPRLKDRRHQRAGTLSGGEQQMLAIGRCLMGNPKLVMLDEPSLGLSPIMTDSMFEIIGELIGKDITVLLVEQNVAESLAISSDAYVLENGEVVLSGAPTDLMNDDRIRQAYLGL